MSNGNKLWIWECNGATNQQWAVQQHVMRRPAALSRPPTATEPAGQSGTGNDTWAGTGETGEGAGVMGRAGTHGVVPWLVDIFKGMRDAALLQSGERVRRARPWHQQPGVREWYANQSTRPNGSPRILRREGGGREKGGRGAGGREAGARRYEAGADGRGLCTRGVRPH